MAGNGWPSLAREFPRPSPQGVVPSLTSQRNAGPGACLAVTLLSLSSDNVLRLFPSRRVYWRCGTTKLVPKVGVGLRAAPRAGSVEPRLAVLMQRRRCGDKDHRDT